MAIEQKLHLKLSQRLVMTPTLQQAIKLLQISRLELEQALVEEAQVNPVLEMTTDEESPEEGTAGEYTPSQDNEGLGEYPVSLDAKETKTESAEPFGEVELDSLFANYLHDTPSLAASWDDDEDGPLSNTPSGEASLFENLCNQIHLQDIPVEIVPICEFIVGNLDADGFLRMTNEEIATQLGTNVERIGEAVFLVQQLDPAGIGARSLCESLRLQILRGSFEDSAASQALLLVSEGFDDLLHQRWDRLQQRLGFDKEDIRVAIELIKKLDPRPGAQLGVHNNPTVEPDLIITKENGRWRVTLNDEGLPRLRLSQRYVQLLKRQGLDSEAKGYLRERMRAALWFLRSIDQRQNTIVRVGEAIVRRQEDFLDRGLTNLKPLVLRDIADDIGMHESTVSRVVNNKFMSTPRGVFPLKFFFHSAISHALEGDISSLVVKERIKELISQEEPKHPLSDARVARQLNRLGIRIARRTVAKYREELGLPSSEQRRRVLR